MDNCKPLDFRNASLFVFSLIFICFLYTILFIFICFSYFCVCTFMCFHMCFQHVCMICVYISVHVWIHFFCYDFQCFWIHPVYHFFYKCCAFLLNSKYVWADFCVFHKQMLYVCFFHILYVLNSLYVLRIYYLQLYDVSCVFYELWMLLLECVSFPIIFIFNFFFLRLLSFLYLLYGFYMFPINSIYILKKNPIWIIRNLKKLLDRKQISKLLKVRPRLPAMSRSAPRGTATGRHEM